MKKNRLKIRGSKSISFLLLLFLFSATTLVTKAQNSVSVTVYPLPTITLGSNPAVCKGVTTASLTYSATTGSPTTYSINFDATAETAGFVDVTDQALPASPISITVPGAGSAGTYNAVLTVKNGNSCTSTSSNITVTINTIPGAATISNNSRCGTGTVLMTAGIGANGDRVDFSENGGTATAGSDASSPYEYTTSSITAGSSATIHVRTYNTTTGCASAWTNSATASANTIPTANAGSNPGDITCTNTTRSLSGSGGGTYAWSTADGNITAGANTATPTINAGGTYSLTVTVSGCSSSNSATVTVTQNNTTPSVATISNNTRCGTGTVLMTAAVGSNGDRVDFSTDGGTSTASSDATSPYEYTTASITAGSSATIHVRTYNTTTGCASAWTNSATATAYAIPTANAGANPGDITCTNSTRTLSGSGGGSYAWSTADGNITAGGTTATPTINAGGTYSLTVTVNGCASSNSATVTVTQNNTTPTVATIANNTRCGTGTVLMTANVGANGDRVDFSIDGGTSIAASDATSAYEYTTASITAGSSVTVHVRTYNTTTGCASAWTNSATATAYAIPTANAGSNPGDITCANPTRTLSGSGGGTYAWSTADGNITAGANTATPTVDNGGTYSLTVTVNGCSSSNSATVTVTKTATIPGVATIANNSRCGTGTVLMTANIGSNGDRVDFSIDGGTSIAASDATSAYEYTTASINAGSSVTVHVRTYNTTSGCASAWTNSGVATARPIPTATIAKSGDICSGESLNISFTLTGTANWTVKYSDGSTTTTVNGIAASPHSVSVSPTANTTYTITEVSDAYCTNTAP